MKRVFKIIGLVFLAGFIFLLIFYLIKNEKLPEGTPSPEADQMAMNMMAALNKAAWDSTTSVSWTFRGDHYYDWNRVENVVTVKWDDIQVLLDPEKVIGAVNIDGERISGPEAERAIKKAWDNFNNDSFWLYAPFKAFDPGTKRSIVTCKDGRKGLMVSYTSGGSTPGDSYVWILDENNRPSSVKMWVSVLPIGGIEFSWENYQRLGSGALVARDHLAFGMLNVSLKNID